MKYLKLFEDWNTFEEYIDSICSKYGITNYTINSDGLVDVNGSVSLSHLSLRSLPVRFGSVTGDFHCSYNNLTSLEGGPYQVGGNFHCIGVNLIQIQ